MEHDMLASSAPVKVAARTSIKHQLEYHVQNPGWLYSVCRFRNMARCKTSPIRLYSNVEQGRVSTLNKVGSSSNSPVVIMPPWLWPLPQKCSQETSISTCFVTFSFSYTKKLSESTLINTTCTYREHRIVEITHHNTKHIAYPF